MCFIHIKYNTLVKGDKMSIAYHKKTNKKYVQYTLRLEEGILEDIKTIAQEESMSINEIVNQSLRFAIDDYKKNKK